MEEVAEGAGAGEEEGEGVDQAVEAVDQEAEGVVVVDQEVEEEGVLEAEAVLEVGAVEAPRPTSTRTSRSRAGRSGKWARGKK